MNWTNEKPKGAGYYFYKHHQDCGCQVVDLIPNSEGQLYALTGFGGSCVKLMDGQWAGPIPEPTDATQPHYVDKAVGMDLNEGLK